MKRRAFLRTLSAAGGFLAGGPLPAADKVKRNMIVRSTRPEDLEMPLDGFATWITPIERFFVRSHMYTPKVDLSRWQLRVEGEVATPLTLTMEDLRKLPQAELAGVLECAGNGRSFYRPTVAGLQWEHGSVGNGRWKGVRLADVLKRAGIRASGKHVLLDGADVPMGTMPDFVRTIPAQKALHADTLLAFDMNGEPLPVAHGFPLRAIVPGWAGDSWTKWITHVRVLDKEHDGFFMKTAYRYPVTSVAPGSSVDQALMTPVESLRPKSVIGGPLEGSRVGADGKPVRIWGVAWSGEAPVAKVEVSTDSGRTWLTATLGQDRDKYAWRSWEHFWTPPRPAHYVLMARATDARGETQPFAQDWNPSGYLWNVVPQVRVEGGPGPEMMSTMPTQAAPEFPPKVKQACIGCHESDAIAGQRLTRAQWEREADKMIRWGATVKPEDRPELIDFLARHFGVR
ncbi:MAG: sulfite oxidase [Acidobacteria bacterium]|nr:sulfite oxidase [Acidobacteriota bacterium]